MFAGIVHEVGGFYLISKTEANPELLHNPTLMTLEAEATIGRAVLVALAVPAEVVAAVESLWSKRSPALPPRQSWRLALPCQRTHAYPVAAPATGQA